MNINCIYTKGPSWSRTRWCKNLKIKGSLFGIGARVCPVLEGKKCEHQKCHSRPKPPKGSKK